MWSTHKATLLVTAFIDLRIGDHGTKSLHPKQSWLGENKAFKDPRTENEFLCYAVISYSFCLCLQHDLVVSWLTVMIGWRALLEHTWLPYHWYQDFSSLAIEFAGTGNVDLDALSSSFKDDDQAGGCLHVGSCCREKKTVNKWIKTFKDMTSPWRDKMNISRMIPIMMWLHQHGKKNTHIMVRLGKLWFGSFLSYTHRHPQTSRRVSKFSNGDTPNAQLHCLLKKRMIWIKQLVHSAYIYIYVWMTYDYQHRYDMYFHHMQYVWSVCLFFIV